jgi:hypothetical protein
MVAALADGGADPVALRTVASAAFLGQEYDLALASLALAHRAAPSQAFAEGVEQDFNQIARKHSVEQVGKIMAFDFREIAGDSPQRSDLADMVVLEAARMGAGTT